jgi:hypothetical protein
MLAGETVIEFRTGTTVRVARPLTDPELAVIVTTPVAIPVATPPFTVAIAVLEELHVALAVRFCVLPSVYRALALKGCVLPLATVALLGVTLIELTAGGSTVNVAVPLIEPEVAVSVTVPCVSAVATPPLTVAIAMFDELQVALLVKF